MREVRPKVTTAGQLLEAIAKSGAIELDQLARRVRVSTRSLEECRAGVRALTLESQIILAGVVLLLAPQHGGLARRLHAQAQAALRMRDGDVECHMSYMPTHRWENVR